MNLHAFLKKRGRKPAVVLLGGILLAAAAAGQTPSAPSTGLAIDRPVLLIIDIQDFYFAGGKVPLAGSVEASLEAKALLGAFRAKKLPVIHVQHLPKGIEKYEPGVTEAQYAFHSNVAPVLGEAIVAKHFANAFRETNLQALLKGLDAKTLVIAGMQTHMCVEAATRAGADLGYSVVLAADACATRDLKFGDTIVPAASVHAAVLAAMSGSYARVAMTAEVIAALK
jgi:nicotinamidase-related amidase